MGCIRRLPVDLANQIAAGEVVERPASVVKELVENAVDAGASRVHVEIDQGGLTRLRVSDDGRGMAPDDAVLSLERHATSKLRGAEDLFALRTFGFRGEALPSIASVSRLRLVTRERGAVEGTEVQADGGAAKGVAPKGAPEGTSVEIRDLFYNVPARRKFLKSTATEAAHVGEVVLFAALARPDISFFLARDGRPAREWLRVAARAERAAQAHEGEELEPCVSERGPLRLEAHLAAPERARAGATGLHLLVNGRPVRDRALARAVAQAYGSVLDTGRYPLGVVYLDLPRDQVDVNVHPQKAEVRFADARGIFGVVTRELRAALAKAFAVPALGQVRAFEGRFERPAASLAETRPDVPWDGLARAADALDESARGPARPNAPPASALPASALPASALPASVLPASTAPAGATPASTAPASAAPARTPPVSEAPASAPLVPSVDRSLFDGPAFYGSLEYLGQARATYLVCAGRDGLYVLDQHAAAERVTFDRLRRAFAARSVAMQRLLVPEIVPLSPLELAALERGADGLAALERGADGLAALGLEVRAIGTGAVAVHAVPALLSRVQPERLVRDLLAELSHAAKRPFHDAADLVLATMACHGSVRAGDILTREEAAALLGALDGIDFAGHCPHGRPIVTRLPWGELEHRVGR